MIFVNIYLADLRDRQNQAHMWSMDMCVIEEQHFFFLKKWHHDDFIIFIYYLFYLFIMYASLVPHSSFLQIHE